MPWPWKDLVQGRDGPVTRRQGGARGGRGSEGLPCWDKY